MEQEIISLIAKTLEVEPEEIEMDTAVGDLPEWDSLHHLMIIKAIEEKYGFKFNPTDLAELEDVSDLIALVKEMKG